ncbi:c-type cytochrome [Caldalkalibacillus salinus]|uniref:c-type cytochrome n=1 Tax=Caldalkalibacillus salinus TaxID=2803787 RepID=UPI0019205DF5|nr:cytochrome c [Caldalkalibacillus salinus]
MKTKRSKWFLIFFVCLLSITLITACGAGDEAPPEQDEAETPADPEQDQEGQDPATDDPATEPDEATEDEQPDEEAGQGDQDAELVAAGEEVVHQSCIGCHGENLEGNMGPTLHGVSKKYSEEELNDILVNGIGQMPKGTAGGEEEAVIAYLQTLE